MPIPLLHSPPEPRRRPEAFERERPLAELACEQMAGRPRLWLQALHVLGVLSGSLIGTALCLFSLPTLSRLTQTPKADSMLRRADTIAVRPPPRDEPPLPPQPDEQEDIPELDSEQQREQLADLSQMEFALNAVFSGSGGLAGSSWRLPGEGGLTELTKLLDEGSASSILDLQPRAVYQPSPVLTTKEKRHTPGQVKILFEVDERGRVDQPRVESSTHPALERAALEAVRKWRFEPGTRRGKTVRFRMRVPITYRKFHR